MRDFWRLVLSASDQHACGALPPWSDEEWFAFEAVADADAGGGGDIGSMASAQAGVANGRQ
jgi:hypothetical protein